MKSILHIIESNNLFGLADNHNIEIVECVYDKIIPLTNGKYIVIKDKMAGILDSEGKILFYPQAKRIHYIKDIDIFHPFVAIHHGGSAKHQRSAESN